MGFNAFVQILTVKCFLVDLNDNFNCFLVLVLTAAFKVPERIILSFSMISIALILISSASDALSVRLFSGVPFVIDQALTNN